MKTHRRLYRQPHRQSHRQPMQMMRRRRHQQPMQITKRRRHWHRHPMQLPRDCNPSRMQESVGFHIQAHTTFTRIQSSLSSECPNPKYNLCRTHIVLTIMYPQPFAGTCPRASAGAKQLSRWFSCQAPATSARRVANVSACSRVCDYPAWYCWSSSLRCGAPIRHGRKHP